MKKLLFVALFVALAAGLQAQTAAPTTAEDIRQIDNAVKSLATQIATQLTRERVATLMLGPFAYMGSDSQLNAYLGGQLTEELSGVQGRSFTLVSGGAAEWIVSGEIVVISDMVRVYSRLVRRSDNALVRQIHTDLPLNRSLSGMLASVSSRDARAALVLPDAWEVDAIDTPVEYTIAAATPTPMDRTLQRDDEDWFVIAPAAGSHLVLETTGDLDTRMTLYDAATREELASNDDDGNNSNAQIRRFARAGERYIVKVGGYSSEEAGNYGFVVRTEQPEAPTPHAISADIDEARFVMGRLGGGGDTFLLAPQADGQLVMETSGSNDVVMELYDAETYDLLASDDDSGSNNNARIEYQVQRGRSYLAKVRAYGSATGEYGFKAYME